MNARRWTTGGPAIAAHGITVFADPAWDVRIRRRPPVPPESTHAVMHAGTFALPAVIGDYGDGGLHLMGTGDVFVALVEFDPASTATALFARRGFPAPLVGDDLRRTGLQHAIGDQAGAQRFFSVNGRAWCLYVVVGSFRGRHHLAGVANALIGGIEVASS